MINMGFGTHPVHPADEPCLRYNPGAWENFTCTVCGAELAKKVGKAWKTCGGPCAKEHARRQHLAWRRSRGYARVAAIRRAETDRRRPKEMLCLTCGATIPVPRRGVLPVFCFTCHPRNHHNRGYLARFKVMKVEVAP